MLRVVLITFVLLCQGCASTLFVPYPDQANSWRQAISTNQFNGVSESLATKTQGNDGLLYLQEKGRIEQLAGDMSASQSSFNGVFARYDAKDNAASVQASSLTSGLTAMVTNDNALAYPGYAYERIFAHAYQALNYLAQGQLEGAQVELRRAALEQRVAQEKNDKDIAKAEQDAADNNLDLASFDGYFQGLNTAAAAVRSAVNNAWTYYLSGVIWEASGDYNAALVDYKNALQIVPSSKLLVGAVERASAQIDRRWNPEEGLVVIVHEEGLVPPKREVSIPVPTIHGYFSVAFPTYQALDILPPQPLQVRGAGSETTSTEVLARVNGMAAKTLKDRIPGMIVRQTLRAAAKYETQKHANDNFGLVGALTTQIYNLVSERADLRSWLSLPAYGMGAELMLPAGNQQLVLAAPGANKTLDIPVRAGRITLVRVVHVGSMITAQVMPL